MNKYLESVRNGLKCANDFRNVRVVIGNESCDLDSVVSALVYSFYLYGTVQKCKTLVVPVLNVPKEELPLKTESVYFLRRCGVDVANLVFRDEIDLRTLFSSKKLQLTLVDHHSLVESDAYLGPAIVEIIDHRPVDPSCKWEDVECEFAMVGSCCTLVGRRILEGHADVLDESTALLLYGTIVVDTVCFSEAAKRTTALDRDVVARLRKQFNITCPPEELFRDIVEARSDISTLTPLQVLSRDMKIVNGLPTPGVPMLVADFLLLPGAEESLHEFCNKRNVSTILLMGLESKNGNVRRDLGVFKKEDCVVYDKVLKSLTDFKDLELKEKACKIGGVKVYEQCNVKLSRKQIVPVVKAALSGVDVK